MNLKGRNFLTLKDFTPEEITYMIDLAADLKAKKKAGELHEYYRGKNIALIFEKTSTRTRCYGCSGSPLNNRAFGLISSEFHPICGILSPGASGIRRICPSTIPNPVTPGVSSLVLNNN